MKEYKIFIPKKVGSIELKNRIVTSPMTRSRAIVNSPDDLVFSVPFIESLHTKNIM